MYSLQPVKDVGIKVEFVVCNAQVAYSTIESALTSFYKNQHFYKTKIELISPTTPNLNRMKSGQTSLNSHGLRVKNKPGKAGNMGFINTSYFKGTKDVPKKDVDYAASQTFANTTITTYEAITLWINTTQPKLPNHEDVKDINKDETNSRRSLERDTLLEFLKLNLR